MRVWKKTVGDSLTESSSGWWWGNEKIDEDRFLFFFLALALVHSLGWRAVKLSK